MILHYRNKLNQVEINQLGVVATLLDDNIDVSEFELHSRFYIDFLIINLGKDMNPFIP